MLLTFAPGTSLADLFKAYIHGHYRRHPNGQQVWVDSYSDKRPERHRTEFAHWQHRIEHFKDHLAQGHTREALHAFHDLGHDDSHKLARDLGLHDDGPEFADKKTLMGAVHGRILARKQELQAKVGAQVKADFEKRKAAGMVGKKVGKARAKDTVTMPKQELIAEHEKLVAVLKSPDHADDLKEAKEQEKELKGYTGEEGTPPTNITPSRDSNDRPEHNDSGMGVGAGLAPTGPAPASRPANTVEQPYQEDGIKLSRGDITRHATADILPGELAGHLRPHGRDAVNLALEQFGAGYRSFLIADGTGAGKTRQALAVCEALRRKDPDKPILIVTQNTRVIQDAFAKDAATMGIQIKPVDTLAEVQGGGIYVTVYTRVGRGDFKGGKFGTVVYDEAHNLKNYTSKKTQAGTDLAKAADRSLLLTATPGDRAEHIGYLATAFGFSFTKAMNALGYEKGDYGFERAYGVTVDDSLQRMGALFDDFTRRGLMVKREVSMDNIDVHQGQVTLSEQDASTMDQAWGAMQEQVAFAKPRQRGLVKMLGLAKLRTALEPFKINATMAAVDTDIKAGKKVVVFANRINDADLPAWWPDKDVGANSVGTLDELASRLEASGVKVGRLYGKHLSKAKATLRGFQEGDTDVVIATPQAGGTGINLDDTVGNSPRSMIVMTAPFSSLEAVQQIGRINRLTTKSRASVRFLVAEGAAVDEWNLGIIKTKLARLGASVEGDVSNIRLDRQLEHASDEDLARIGASHVPVREGVEVDLAKLGLKDPGDSSAAPTTGQTKTFLRVPYDDKDWIKAKYPRSKFSFDAVRKQWYVVGDIPDDLKQYLPPAAPAPAPATAPAAATPAPTPVPVISKPMTSDQIKATWDALAHVAGRCDGARDLDGMGFNRQDVATYMHLISLGDWSPEEAARARAMVYKYKGQFGDDLARRMGNPHASAEVAPADAAAAGKQAATYNGRSYAIGWSGNTRYGHRTKLVRADGGEFWVNTSALTLAKACLRHLLVFRKPIMLKSLVGVP